MCFASFPSVKTATPLPSVDQVLTSSPLPTSPAAPALLSFPPCVQKQLFSSHRSRQKESSKPFLLVAPGHVGWQPL